MKKLLALLLVLALLFSMSGCGLSAAQQILEDLTAESEPADKPQKPSSDVGPESGPADDLKEEIALRPLSLLSVPREENEYNDVGFSLYCSWEEIALPEPEGTAFAALSTAMATLSAARRTQAMQYAEELRGIAQDIAGEGGRDFICSYTDDFTVRRADTELVSLLYCSDYYAGGVHPSKWFEGITLDVHTGAALQLKEVFSDPELLAVAIWTELEALFPDSGLFDSVNTGEIRRMVEENSLPWVLDPAGLTIVFSEQMIAPHATGSIVVTIPYAWYPEQFDDRCARLPEAYAVELDPLGNVPVFFDVDAADGYMDSVAVETVTEDGVFVDSLRAVINGTAYELATELTGNQRAYLLRLPDGGACIYLFASSGPWETLYVASLGTAGVSGVKTLPDAAQVCYITKEYEEFYELLTDPQSFRLAFYVEMLGSLSGIRKYVAGADGMPLTLQKDYLLENELVLTLLQPMTFELKAGGEKEFPEGTALTFLATDGKTWVDMYTDTGDAVRIYVDKSDWPDYVNGVEVFEVFDGMMYAG